MNVTWKRHRTRKNTDGDTSEVKSQTRGPRRGVSGSFCREEDESGGGTHGRLPRVGASPHLGGVSGGH